MSTSAKKTGGAKSAGSKTSGARGAAQSSSRAGASKKAASPKKRAPKKKKKGGGVRWPLVAFALGILLSALAFWLLRAPSAPDPLAGGARVQKEAPAVRAASKGAATAAPKAAGAEKSGRKAAAPPAGEKKAATPEASSPGRGAEPGRSGPGEKPPARAPGADEERGAATGGAVASALIDLQSLPYEESLSAPLDERIRQVDYALMQAAWMSKLPARALRLVSVEDRLEGVEPYQFQVIDILPGKDARAFKAALKDCLAAWAEGASLVDAGTNVWAVSIKGAHTHSLRLYPGRDAFPPLSGAGGEAPPPGGAGPEPAPERTPAPYPALPAPRLRGSGEEARLVIVIDDLGANPKAVERLLALDYPVTFAFWPHGKHTREGALAASAGGREILVHLPMEPLGYPRVQPGPNVLLTGMDEARIRAVVEAGIAAVPHAVGLNNHMGSRFTQSRRGVDAVIRVLREKGLFMLDSLTHGGSVFAAEGRRLGIRNYSRNVFLDTEHTKADVLAALRRAERIALLSGHSVAIGHPLPETLEALREWQRLRNKEVRIVRLGDLPGE